MLFPLSRSLPQAELITEYLSNSLILGQNVPNTSLLIKNPKDANLLNDSLLNNFLNINNLIVTTPSEYKYYPNTPARYFKYYDNKKFFKTNNFYSSN